MTECTILSEWNTHISLRVKSSYFENFDIFDLEVDNDIMRVEEKSAMNQGGKTSDKTEGGLQRKNRYD